jgi:ECF transporter S component (folate family)
MRKNTSNAISTRTLVSCALLAAASVVLARLIIPMPNVTTRFSIEAVPVFMAGMLFGSVPGMLVGFAADFIGCLFSGFGYNPLFCVPPLLYGLFGGLFQAYLVRKVSLPRLALAFLPPVALGSILYQSFSLTLVYSTQGAFWPNFLVRLGARSVQFAITYVLEVLIIFLLYKSKVFTATRMWPPAPRRARKSQKFQEA